MKPDNLSDALESFIFSIGLIIVLPLLTIISFIWVIIYTIEYPIHKFTNRYSIEKRRGVYREE